MTERSKHLTPIELEPLSQRPLVSVLMANYNYARFVGEAIKSVLSQTYPSFELVICDDGSTDESMRVITDCVAGDSRVRILRKANGGQASALNAAFAESYGEIICFLDSDDLYERRKIERVVAAFIEYPNDGYLVHPVRRIDETGRAGGVMPLTAPVPRGWHGERLLASGGVLANTPPCSGLCVRREVAKRIFPISERFVHSADAVVLRIAPLTTSVIGLDEPLVRYRLHGGNVYNTKRVSSEWIDRDLETRRVLWEEQKRFLGGIDSELAERLLPLEASLSFVMSSYQSARGRRSEDTHVWYRKMISHTDFRDVPVARKLFWRCAGHMPDWMYDWTSGMLFGQNRLKSLVEPLARVLFRF